VLTDDKSFDLAETMRAHVLEGRQLVGEPADFDF
jgi:hypothetical protein